MKILSQKSLESAKRKKILILVTLADFAYGEPQNMCTSYTATPTI